MVKKLELVDSPEKVEVKNCFKITLDHESRYQAARMLGRRGLLNEEDFDKFEGPDFKDIKGYSLNGPWIVVQLKDDTQYIYPAASVARIKTYTE